MIHQQLLSILNHAWSFLWALGRCSLPPTRGLVRQLRRWRWLSYRSTRLHLLDGRWSRVEYRYFPALVVLVKPAIALTSTAWVSWIVGNFTHFCLHTYSNFVASRLSPLPSLGSESAGATGKARLISLFTPSTSRKQLLFWFYIYACKM